VRIYVLLGQGGAITSYGMYGLANQLRAISGVVCTIHSWTDRQEVINELRQSRGKDVLIGFSLGANSVTQIAEILKSHRIDLLVAYDASVLQTEAGGIRPIGKNVDRTLCYRSTNPFLAWGHGQLVGHNVTTYETADNHLAVCYDGGLHALTIQAVKDIDSGTH
jgi:hypothetical protein